MKDKTYMDEDGYLRKYGSASLVVCFGLALDSSVSLQTMAEA
jgi:hypothetical protein